jgi:Tfp pilus assembly protein PilV
MHRVTRDTVRSSEGVSLVEIVVAMFILALIAMAFLPLLVQGVRQSAASATRATAVQLVSDQIDQARSAGTSCAVVRALVGVLATTDSRGNSLTRTNTAGTCSAVVGTYPTTLTFTVNVTRAGGISLAKASTLIYVGAP